MLNNTQHNFVIRKSQTKTSAIWIVKQNIDPLALSLANSISYKLMKISLQTESVD